MRARIVVGAAILGLRSLVAGELTLEAPLTPERLSGCVLANGVLTLPEPLPVQQGRSAVCVEAESFRSITWQNPPGEPVTAADAGAGRCLAFVSEAVYHLSIERAGDYWYWQRVWIPRRASWSHSVQIDDAPPMHIAFGTREADKAETWFWIPGGTRFLSAGVHALVVRDLHNGKRLDRWVLTTDSAWRPEAVGPAATPVRAIDTGEYLSRPLTPLSVSCWQRLGVDIEGQATVEISTGDGPFRALPADGSLAGDRVPLRVRARLRRDAAGRPGQVEFGVVQYAADQADFHVLQNGRLRLLLHRETGRLCGLQDRNSGRRYLPDGVPATLFELVTKTPESPDTVRLSSDDAVAQCVSRGRRQAQFRYAFADQGLRVAVAIRIRRDAVAVMRLTVDNDSERDVIATVFPRLAQAGAGRAASDDVLCFPSMSGQLVREPGQAGTLRNSHPIRTTIGFCDLHDREGGVMLAPLDYPMVLTEFVSEPDPSCRSTTLMLERRDRVRPGQSATFTAAVGIHAGDWHAAADWYRDWFGENVGKPRIPDWVYDSDGWVTSWDTERMAGLGFQHIQMWGETGYGGCPTYSYPNPNYHSEAWFTQLAARWRGLGGHLGVYYHANGVSRSYLLADKIYGIPVEEIPPAKRPPTWDWFVRNSGYSAERQPVEKLDMTGVDEPAAKEEYPTMCWQAGSWRDYLEKWALDIYLKEYGLDTPYWDTFGCYDRQDFSPFFGHNGEGRGAMARYQFLLDMQAKGERHSRGFYQTVEGGSELLGLVSGQLQSNFVRNLEVGRYTHPEQVYYIGHSNGWWTPPKTHKAACMAFYLNTKLDLIRLTPKVMEVVRCRRWLAPWLFRSRFMDDRGLSVSSPEVKAALHLSRHRRGDALIATFMNWPQAQAATATVDVGRYLTSRRRLGAYLVSQAQLPVELRADTMSADGTWTIELPAAPVSAVLFLERPDRALPVVQARQERAQQLVQVFDPARKPRVFALQIRTAEASFQPDPACGDIPGAFLLSNLDAASDRRPLTYGRTIDYVDYPGLRELHHADITLSDLTVSDGGSTLTTRSLVAPHFIDPDFEGEMFDDSEAQSGERSLKITPSQKLRHFPLELISGHEYRISLWIKKLETKGNGLANVHHHMVNRSHHFGARFTPGKWVCVETTYVMPDGLDQPHLYLYNWQGATMPAWFDHVVVEDLGLAEDK